MKYTIEQLKKMVEKEEKSLPKILIFDIETAPMQAFVWKRYKENISLDQTISESYMLCWSAKWLYEEEVMGDCLTAVEAGSEDDYRIVKSLYDLINQADIIVAYNGKNFDIPYMNQRFLFYDFPPYAPVQVVDPYETAKMVFRFSSNKMDNVATQLGLQNKIKTDFDLWKGCIYGEEECLNEMLEYNKQDVVVLEEIYCKILPWIKNHPNISNYFDDKHRCTRCGSEDIKKLNRYFYTPSGKYELYRCKKCGSIFRGRKNLNTSKVPFLNCTH
jgi:DNA polymerase III epsilon subunit-like protein/ribosomal protein L37AE/L43A